MSTPRPLILIPVILICAAAPLHAQEYDAGQPVSTPAGSPAVSFRNSIEASAKIEEAFHRASILSKIAGDPEIQEEDQLHLIENLKMHPMEEFYTADVLTTLLNNPSTTPAVRQTVTDNIGDFGLSSFYQSSVLSALAGDRGASDRPLLTREEKDIVKKVAAGLGIFFFILLLVFLIPVIFFLRSLSRCLSLIQPKNRAMSPGQVWLSLIPLFNLFWTFYIVFKIRDSLAAEFGGRGAILNGEDYGFGIGIAMAACSAASWIPVLGGLASLGALVTWIIYWIKIADYNRKLAAQPLLPSSPPLPG